MRRLALDDIEALAVGAWILGTGGGGSPYLALLNMRLLYAEGVAIDLLDPLDLADDDRIAVVSNQGAPLVGQERLTDSRVIARAVALMAEYTGQGFRAVMALEIGGGNGIQPMMAAARLRLPVVDADCMGRAYPEAQMTSFAVGDLQPWPLTSVDARGNEAIVSRVPTWKWMERVSRRICVEYGSIASTCKAPRTGAEVKRWGILHTTTKAIRIGHAVRQARRAHADPIAALLATEPGKLLFKGKVLDVERRTTEGFLRGRIRLEGIDDFRDAALEIAFQNEWTVAWLDGVALVSTARPDLCPRQRIRAMRSARRRCATARGSPWSRCPRRRCSCRSAAWTSWVRAPSAMTWRSAPCSHEAHRHRRRRHQHRCGAGRVRAGAARGQGADHRGSDRRHPGRLAAAARGRGDPGRARRCRHDRHHALHQRRDPAPGAEPRGRAAHRPARRRLAAAVLRLARRPRRPGARRGMDGRGRPRL